MRDESEAMAALGRLFDQAFNTAGDEAGRLRAGADYSTVAYWLGRGSVALQTCVPSPAETDTES
jgi:hypothetical protein